MRRGIAMVCASSVAYGLMPLLTTELYGMGFSVVSASFWRFFLAVPMLILACGVLRIDVRLPWRRALRLCLAVGAPSGATMLLLNGAYASIDVGLATTVHFLYPALVAVLAALIYHDHITAAVRRSIACIALGMAVLTGGLSLRGDGPGLMCAATSAFTYAIYLLQLDHGGFSKLSPLVTTTYIAATNSVLMLIVGVATQPVQMLNGSADCLVALGLAGLSLFALYCLAAGSRFLVSHYVAVFGLLEPITSVACGVVFLGESFTASKLIGVTLVALAIIIVVLEGRAPAGHAMRRAGR